MQANWIGRSEGLLIRWPLGRRHCAGRRERARGLHDAAGHDLRRLLHGDRRRPSAGQEGRRRTTRSSPPSSRRSAACGTSAAALETAEKKGFDTGIRVVHPFDPNWTLPVYVANFVLMDYGTGAIFGCPSGDQRDLDFANKYGLPVVPVVMPEGADAATLPDHRGGLCRRRRDDQFALPRRHEAEARPSTRSPTRLGGVAIGNRPMGERKVQFRLRDWLISRQRYWGCPIPVIHCDDCGAVPVPDTELPVELPERRHASTSRAIRSTTIRPGSMSPARNAARPARRDTDTMDTFVDSSWYFARFTDPWNEAAPTTLAVVDGGERLAAGQPVYRRHRARDPAPALFALLVRAMKATGHLNAVEEPFEGLFTQGMVVHETYKGPDGWVTPAEVEVERGRRRAPRDAARRPARRSRSARSRRCRSRRRTSSTPTTSSPATAPTRRAGSCCRIRRRSAT